jgi:hypothetical protein
VAYRLPQCRSLCASESDDRNSQPEHRPVHDGHVRPSWAPSPHSMICGLLHIGGDLGHVAPAGEATGAGRPQLRSNFAAKRRWTVGADSISKGLTVGMPSWAGCLWEPLALARAARLLSRPGKRHRPYASHSSRIRRASTSSRLLRARQHGEALHVPGSRLTRSDPVPIAVVQGPEVLAFRCRERHVPRDTNLLFRLRHAASGFDLAGDICEGFVHLRTHGCREQAAEERKARPAASKSAALTVVVSIRTAVFTGFSTGTAPARLASDTRRPMIVRDCGAEIWNELRKDLCERLAVPAASASPCPRTSASGDACGTSTRLAIVRSYFSCGRTPAWSISTNCTASTAVDYAPRENRRRVR